MIPTAHLFTGGAIGAALRRQPWLVPPVAFASHLVLDAVPHLDEAGLFRPRYAPPPEMQALVVLDAAVGVLLLWWMHRRLRGADGGLWAWVAAGAFFALLPDLVDNMPYWSPELRAYPLIAALHAVHAGVQWNVPIEQWLLGTVTQVVAIAAGAWGIWRIATGRGGRSGPG